MAVRRAIQPCSHSLVRARRLPPTAGLAVGARDRDGGRRRGGRAVVRAGRHGLIPRLTSRHAPFMLRPAALCILALAGAPAVAAQEPAPTFTPHDHWTRLVLRR